jgi:hypothetical protein
VYCDAVEGPGALVLVKAIGVKVRERILIGGEAIDL